jgi:transcriptional regulator GlxA family with amidase domain
VGLAGIVGKSSLQTEGAAATIVVMTVAPPSPSASSSTAASPSPPTAPTSGRARRRIVIVVFDGVQSLDLTGPLEVFTGADRYIAARRTAGGLVTTRGTAGYEITTAAIRPGPMRTSSGLAISADTTVADLLAAESTGAPDDAIDTLVVAGGQGVDGVLLDAEAIETVVRLAARSRRVTSVCSGAFVLAEAGLLDGRRATTHWARCRELAERYPRVTVDPDPIFTRDGDLYTSAGVTAGMDLALALVEDDLGREAALTVARHLVLFLRRPANQAQFSTQLSTQFADRDELRALQEWIADHVAEDCSVDRLAERAAMSPRHLARLFSEQVGTTVARYVEQVRVETARRRLEESSDPIAAVAATCGFGTAETMRRTFLRALGIGPAEYRRRFRSAVA